MKVPHNEESRLVIVVALLFVSALACAQASLLPEPPQVTPKDHVVSLTLRAVNRAMAATHSRSTARPTPQFCGYLRATR